jgi:hypothetical protein
VVTTLPKTANNDKPWHRYRREPNWKLSEPGWAGVLDDAELAYILAHLKDDASLRLWWGMRLSWKRIPEEVVRRVALEGDPDNQAYNCSLARPRRGGPSPGALLRRMHLRGPKGDMASVKK